MGINVTTTPTEVTVNGVTFYMKPDPTNSAEWDALMDTVIVFTDPKKRQKSHDALVEAMAALAYTLDDAETLRKVFSDSTDSGTATLNYVSKEYAKEVTGFPTQPAARSTKP